MHLEEKHLREKERQVQSPEPPWCMVGEQGGCGG